MTIYDADDRAQAIRRAITAASEFAEKAEAEGNLANAACWRGEARFMRRRLAELTGTAEAEADDEVVAR